MPGSSECGAKECLLGISPSSTTVRVCKLPGNSVVLSSACCSFLGGKDWHQNELILAIVVLDLIPILGCTRLPFAASAST